MDQNQEEMQNTSLEDHLTNSIRRAKERIYNNAISTYSQSFEPNDAQIYEVNHNTFEVRNRALSQRQNSHRQDRNALASAMKILQERINQLQKQNSILLNKYKSLQLEFKKSTGERNEKQLVLNIQERQQEVQYFSRMNDELKVANTSLINKVRSLEEELSRMKITSIEQPKINQLDNCQESRPYNSEKEARIRQLEQKVQELQQRNGINHETIDKLIKKVENQKRINLKWIKLHEQSMQEPEQKENNSLEANIETSKGKHRHQSVDPKRQILQLKKNNKELYETIQRNQYKIIELKRECKEAEEKYNKIKLIANEITDHVNKIIPNSNSHLKYLTTKIFKLESNHLQSLRSLSIARKSRHIERSSDSKDRKKSLKMSDLNSSQKKSQERSNSKSNKKKIVVQQRNSQKKKKPINFQVESQVDILEKQVISLKKKYRNLIARAEKDKSTDPQMNKKIQQTAQEYNTKKEKLDALRNSLLPANNNALIRA